MKERTDREILAIYHGAVLIRTPTCCGVLYCVVLACTACCQNENQTAEDIEANRASDMTRLACSRSPIILLSALTP